MKGYRGSSKAIVNLELRDAEAQKKHTCGLQAKTVLVTSFSGGQIRKQKCDRSCGHKCSIVTVLVRGMLIAGGPGIRRKQYLGRWQVGSTVI